jgi:DNA-binding transcriptional LysR family regulator
MTSLPQTQALRCFVTIAREGSVSRAATALHLSQPAVSLQLKSLEEHTGLRLFERTPTGLLLTAAGTALLPRARELIGKLSAFNAAAGSLVESSQKTLHVGTILDPEFIRLGDLVKTLTTADPRIEIFFHHGMSDDVLAQIGRNDLDICFYIDRTPGGPSGRRMEERSSDCGTYCFAPLMNFTYRVIGPAEWSHKFQDAGWEELASLPWLATPTASAHRRLLDDVFGAIGKIPKRVALTDQEEAMVDLVESGVAMSLAREFVLAKRTRPANYAVARGVALDCDLSLACLAGSRNDPAIVRAFAAAKKVWRLSSSAGQSLIA